MLIVDLIAGAMIVGMAAWGYWAGLSGTLPAGAFATGAVVGALLAPLALPHGKRDPFALVFALPGALLVGGLLAAEVERRSLRLRRRLIRQERRNAIGGALLAAWMGVVGVWVLGAPLVQVRAVGDAVDGSVIVGRLNAALTPPGPPVPETKPPFVTFPVVAGAGPRIRPADAGVVDEPRVRAADLGVVRITVLNACGAVGGSGWVGADGVIVTNAHVAAAAEIITVKLGGIGEPHPARAIWFDPVNDVALLRVPELKGVAPLPIAADAKRGTSAATIGFPLGQHEIAPARLGPTTTSIRGRIGGRLQLDKAFLGPLFGRPIAEFRGSARPGGSGGPLVDARGRVLATLFASRGVPDAGLAVPNRFVLSALRRADGPVDTGPCPRPADSLKR